jgi:hypothetical protein
MSIYLKAFICFFILSLVAIASEALNEVEIKGGFMGVITFPHNTHENIVDNCQKCHALFSQQKGVIQGLKDSNALEKKYVMKTLCISCHKSTNSGPTMCYGCHNLIFNIFPSGACLFF